MSTTTKNNENIPWVEKYRPTKFDDIVLEPINREIFSNIISEQYFPNLLLYGPPGTGKTTTIINLINEYQNINKDDKINKKCNILHLNASDERGIDIIRNQILQFVKTQNFFKIGLKFVILDEVDYMTKNAQQALKYLLQSYNFNVRFCLICNYISKIDESLKNEFICIRFNQLPRDEIQQFIHKIAENENIQLSKNMIEIILKTYHSDIRSMINFLQLNQDTYEIKDTIITNEIFETIIQVIKSKNKKKMLQYMNKQSQNYNCDKTSILKMFFHYILRNKSELISQRLLNIMEYIIHSTNHDIEQIIIYFINELHELI
jgi:replication factor C subunit 3/5